MSLWLIQTFFFSSTDVESTFEISPIVIGAVLTVFISCSCIVCRICIFTILKKIRKTEETEVKLNQQTQNHISYADVSFYFSHFIFIRSWAFVK